MERPHYRRVSGEAAKGGNYGRSAFSERLTAQLIACGTIMALILGLNLLDIPFAHGINSSVKDIIQSQPDAEGVKNALARAAGTAKSLFGGGEENFDMASDAWMYNEEPEPLVAGNGGFRIDEDILEGIQSEPGGQ